MGGEGEGLRGGRGVVARPGGSRFPRSGLAKRESRDVAANLRALATIKNTPEKLDKSYL